MADPTRPELGEHLPSWHDMPERVEALIRERDEARRGVGMSDDSREALGRLVREVWVKWAKEQLDPKPSWLVPWEGLAEPDREVDRRIGEAVARATEEALPPEVQRVLALYREGEWEGWVCLHCGGGYPRSIITGCPQCSEAAMHALAGS